MALDDIARAHTVEWLRNCEIRLASLNAYRDVVAALLTADDDDAATTGLTAILNRHKAELSQVLDLQIRRLAKHERTSLADECQRVAAELDGTAHVPPPVQRPIPAGAAMTRFRATPAQPESPPLPAENQAARRGRLERDRRQLLVALAQVGESPLPVLDLVHNAADAESASRALIERFGWSRIQATTVLDMQFRRLTMSNRRGLAAELGPPD